MSNFITALMRQRKEAHKSEDTTGRLKEILGILNKYDYDEGLTPEIVIGILQDLGPTFVKIGQIASQQSEQIPPEYCDALARLRSSVAPMDVDTVCAQIEKYLGKPVTELFASFDDEPLGSASIGQVHRATLADGTVVAVKVRRPGVVETVARDFALIEKAIEFNMKFVKNPGLDIMAMVEELEHTSKMELDFTNEARNLDRFWENNAGRPGVSCPKCYQDLTCEAVLTEDFACGTEAGNADFLATLSDGERDRLASLVADNFATQILIDGFYHADPHSGNVLIHPMEKPVAAEGDPAQDQSADATPENGICWIDFGMMGTLTTKERQTLIDLVTALLKHDAYGLKRTVSQVATPTGEVDHGSMLELCDYMCDQVSGTDLGDFNLGNLMDMVLDALQEANYKVDPFLTNLGRGVIAAEGTVRTLSERVNILNFFIGKVDIGLDGPVAQILSKVTGKDDLGSLAALSGLTDLGGLGGLVGLGGNADLTKKAIEALDMLEKGQIMVHSGFGFDNKSLKQIDRMVGTCIMAAVGIALFIGSCILCLMGDANVTRIHGIPVIGFVGYLLGIFFMFLTVRRVHKDV